MLEFRHQTKEQEYEQDDENGGQGQEMTFLKKIKMFEFVRRGGI